MNIFGGFFHVGTQDNASHVFSSVEGFFNSSCFGVQHASSGGFACWNGFAQAGMQHNGKGLIQESSCNRFLLTGYLRLDYRDELGDKLGVRHKDLVTFPDAILAIKAFEKWGFNFLHHLEGDWSIILFDKLKNILYLFRDPLGAGVLFYFQHAQCLYFSADPRLFEKLDIPMSINTEQFFKLSLKSGMMDDGKTILEGLFILKRGERLYFDGQLDNWQQLPLTPDKKALRFKDDEDYVASFRSTYAAAVRSRLGEGENGLFLSAGLDSSMLCYFAARELLINQKRLKTFTSYPKYVDFFTEEKQSRIREDIPARKFVSAFSNVDASFCNFKDADIGDVIDANQPFSMIKVLVKPNTFWIDGIFNKSGEAGVKTVFTAKMSNYTVSWDAPMIGLNYLLRGRVMQLIQFLKGVSGGTFIGWLKAIKHELIFPVQREIHLLYKRIRFRLLGYSAMEGLIRAEVIDNKNLQLWNFKQRFLPGYSSGVNPRQLRQLIFSTSIDQVGVFSFIDGIRFHIQVVDPSADRRLVTLSFSLPERLFFQQGKRKFLYRAVMSGLLDEKIIEKRTPFPQAYDIGLRLLESKRIKGIITSIKSDVQSIAVFDLSRVFHDFKHMKIIGFQKEGLKASGNILRLVSLYLLMKKFHFRFKKDNFGLNPEQ